MGSEFRKLLIHYERLRYHADPLRKPIEEARRSDESHLGKKSLQAVDRVRVPLKLVC